MTPAADKKRTIGALTQHEPRSDAHATITLLDEFPVVPWHLSTLESVHGMIDIGASDSKARQSSDGGERCTMDLSQIDWERT